MDQLAFVLLHYLAIGALALVAYILGRRLTLRFAYDSFFEQASFSLTLGLGVIAYLVFLLGLIGILRASYLVILLLLGCLICLPAWIDLTRRPFDLIARIRTAARNRHWVIIALGIAALVLLLPILLLPLYPPTSF